MDGFWQAVLYLHLLAVAFFFGGQLALGLVIVPVERRNPDRERLRAMARRFGYGSLAALGILLVTGYALATHEGLWGSSTLQIKLALVGAIVLLTVAHLRWSRLHALQGAILVATLVVIWLGLDLVV
jgi:putative copper export protein